MGGSTTYESPSIFEALKDSAHDLATRAYDAVTGAVKAASPAAGEESSSPGAGKGGAQKTKATLDQADSMS